MKSNRLAPILRPLLAAIALALSMGAHAGSFTYDGQLDDNGKPANGKYDIQLTPWAAAENGAKLSAAITFPAVEVSEGRFRLEFDALAGSSQAAWLELGVREAGSPGAFTALDGRVKALSATLIGQCWSVTGDSGSNPATNFLGTTDSQDLILRSNNVAGLRLQSAISGVVSIAGGSPANFIGAAVVGGVISGGGTAIATENNQVYDDMGTVSGGRGNVVGISDVSNTNQRFATVGGGVNNDATAEGATVGGGTNSAASGARSTIGGGASNVASGSGSTVGGGEQQNASGNSSTVGGGGSNTASGGNSTVAGGGGNAATNSNSTVGGGVQVVASGDSSTASGGSTNLASGDVSTVAGGASNTASGNFSTVSGGSASGASGEAATVVGGAVNTASGSRSTVGGGQSNCAGGFASWAAGNRAKVRPSNVGVPVGACAGITPGADAGGDAGAFVWADSQVSNFVSGGPQQFLARAGGGVGFNTSSIPPIADMVIANRASGTNVDLYMRSNTSPNGINISTVPNAAGASMLIAQYNGTLFVDRLVIDTVGNFTVTADAFKPLGGSWSSSSDARLKREVKPLEGALDRLLQLEGVTFQYTHPDPARRPAGTHTGLIAQDVAKVFPEWVGTDAQGYLTVGSQGFEAQVVEALRELRTEKDVEIAALELENAELRGRLTRIEKQLAQIVRRNGR